MTSKIRKKILFVDHDKIYTGSTVSLLYLIRFFINKGFEVYVLTNKKDDLQTLYNNLGAFSIYANFNLYLPFHFRSCGNIFSLRGIYTVLITLINAVIILVKSPRIIRSINPSIIYVNEYVSFIVGIIGRLLGKKVYYHIRSQMIGGTLGVRSSLLKFLLSKTGDKIFAITKLEAEQFPDYNKIKNDKIFVIREFVGENDFCSISNREQTLSELNILSSSYVCLSLGGFYIYKGTVDVLLALKNLIEKGEDVVLVLIGDYKEGRNNKNSYLNKCLNVIDENKIAQNIRLVETTSNIAKYLEASDVLISSNSISHFSRPIIEAWAKKKPIISSDLPHIREYVDDEVSGIYYKVGNYKELAERIKMLIHNTELGKKIGENGYRIAHNLFDADKNINSLISLMDV